MDIKINLPQRNVSPRNDMSLSATIRSALEAKFPQMFEDWGGRAPHMSNYTITFIGWVLFVISAVGFIIASIGSFWAMFGSVFFLLACIVFMIPYFRPGK